MHTVLLKTTRHGFMDTVFYGSIFHANRKKILYSVGESSNSICFMRSLAKPLQASILFDSNIIKDYRITPEELAIFSGSHSGTNKHLEILKKVFKKHNLKLKDLSIKPLMPLDLKDFEGRVTKLHNNCSGKHTMMLLNCKYFGYDYNYTNPKHILQQKIKAKQELLSEYKSDILTFDGCSTPLWGLPYKNVIKAYFNLFESCPKLIDAIIKNPYLYGGANRFDTELIKLSKRNLFAKVGAGGLVLIYNKNNDEIVLVKMAQDNNDTRRLVTINFLNKIKWLDCDTDKNIYNQKQQIVAKYEFSL